MDVIYGLVREDWDFGYFMKMMFVSIILCFFSLSLTYHLTCRYGQAQITTTIIMYVQARLPFLQIYSPPHRRHANIFILMSSDLADFYFGSSGDHCGCTLRSYWACWVSLCHLRQRAQQPLLRIRGLQKMLYCRERGGGLPQEYGVLELSFERAIKLARMTDSESLNFRYIILAPNRY